jgi:SAM-dependent methyltransferase
MIGPKDPGQYVVQDRGSRARPGRFHPRYWVLTLLCLKLQRVIDTEWLSPGGRLLDYGCGNMPYRDLFEQKFGEYVGADFPGNEMADLVIGSHGQLPVGNEQFDCVLSTQVLEHVVDTSFYLAEAYRVLKPGGSLILSTHGMWKYHPDPTDYRRWTSDGLRLEIHEAGFDIWRVQSVLGMASCALQLWQDATAPGIPRWMRPIYVWLLQRSIGRIEQRNTWAFSRDASVYIVAARKPLRQAPGTIGETDRMPVTLEETGELIPEGEAYIVIDDVTWQEADSGGRRVIPFLERDGEYWGAPPDDDTAIRELKRLRQDGVNYAVVAWTSFWWLEHYSKFHKYLRDASRSVVETDRLIVFDLRPSGVEAGKRSFAVLRR